MTDQANPASRAFAVTPSDTVNFTFRARALFVGGAGNISLVTEGGDTVTFTGVNAGSILPVMCTRVNLTLTTATNIVGLA